MALVEVSLLMDFSFLYFASWLSSRKETRKHNLLLARPQRRGVIEICWPSHLKMSPFVLKHSGKAAVSNASLKLSSLHTVRAEENGVDNNQGDRPSDRGKRGRGRGEMVALLWDWLCFHVLKRNSPICFFKCFFLSIFCLSFDFISTSATLCLDTSHSLTLYHFFVLKQLKKNWQRSLVW